MVSQFRETREHVENETWDKIDKQKEDDKREMATEIDRSMKQKGELTLKDTYGNTITDLERPFYDIKKKCKYDLILTIGL